MIRVYITQTDKDKTVWKENNPVNIQFDGAALFIHSIDDGHDTYTRFRPEDWSSLRVAKVKR